MILWNMVYYTFKVKVFVICILLNTITWESAHEDPLLGAHDHRPQHGLHPFQLLVIHTDENTGGTTEKLPENNAQQTMQLSEK